MTIIGTISNPIAFYEFFSKDEVAVDLTYQSEEYYAQEEFNFYLKSLGIEIEDDTISINETKNQFVPPEKRYKYRLEVDGNPVSYSDSKSSLNRQALDLKGNIRVIENF
jgi:hypothetical protein